MTVGRVREWFAALLLAIALGWGLTPASADEKPSSTSDRERLSSIVQALEKNPLDDRLHAERAWAMTWVIEAPDITVSICADPLNGAVLSDYPHARDILAQYTLAMAARIMSDPATQKDKVAQQMAGVESALTAYRSILTDAPGSRSPELDEVIAVQTRGELADFVRTAVARCDAYGAKK